MDEQLKPTTEPDKGAAPAWLQNLAALSWRVLVVLMLLVVLAYLGSVIWSVLASIGLAIVVSVILAPLVPLAERNGRSRTSAAAIIWVVTVAVGVAVLAVITISFLPYVAQMLERVQAGQAELQATATDLALPTWLDTFMGDVVARVSEVGATAVSSVVGSIAELGGILLLGSFLLFFFLRDGDRAWRWLFQWIDETQREHIDEAGETALQRVGDYVRGTTAMAAVDAVSNLAFMLLLGTPLAIPLAFLTFALAYVPYFGGVASAVVIVLVTLGDGGSAAAAIMAGLILLRFAAVYRFLRPRIYAGHDALTLHPVIVLIVLPIGLQVGGLVGIVLAVPLTAFGFSVAQAAVRVLEPPVPKALPEIVPAWLDGAAQWSWRSLVVLGVGGVLLLTLAALPLFVLPVVLGLILAATVQPIVEALARRGRSRTVASFIAVAGTTAVIAVVLVLSLSQLIEQIPQVGSTVVNGAQQVDDAAGGHLALGVDAVRGGADTTITTVADVARTLAPLAAVLVLAVLLTFFFVRDGAGLWTAAMRHLPQDVVGEVSKAGSRAFGVLGGYMVGTGAISLVGAASQAVIMWFLGLPLVLPVFVLSFFGGFIPYIGSALTTALALLIAISVGTPFDILIMVIWTLLFNIVQGNVVAPLVYNRTTHIHPAIVLASIPAAASLGGIVGMFLVVPVLGVIVVSWRSVLKVLGTDLGEPADPADTAIATDAADGDEAPSQPSGAPA